jgi:hypothetical protein
LIEFDCYFLSLRGHAVFQATDTFDFNFNPVPRLHGGNPLRCARGYDIPRQQGYIPANFICFILSMSVAAILIFLF